MFIFQQDMVRNYYGGKIMFKRFRVLALALTLVMSTLMCIPANAQGIIDSASANGFYNEQEVFDAWGTFTKSEQDDYAGMYIDEKDNLVLLFVNDSESAKSALSKVKQQSGTLVSKDGTQKQNMIVETRKYSYSTLENVMDLLTDKAYSNKAVKTISIDVRNNKIDVGITASATKNDVELFLNSLLATITDEKVDNDIITTHIEANESIELFATVNGTSAINNGVWETTVGVGYYRYSTGERGFITCGHGFSNNDVIRNANGTRLGVITKHVFNGTCDASFVRFDSEDSFVSSTNVHEELTWDVPIVGRTVTQRGTMSGTKSGTVLSNNFSYTGNGYTWRNLIQTNGIMQNGDSGGGMKCGLMDGGRTAKIVGILHGGTSTFSVYIKGEVISNAINS